jgi:Haem-binding domain/Cytochrome P460
MREETKSKWRWVRKLLGILFAGFLLLQFVRPKLSDGPVTAEIQAPDDVRQVLKTACYNCHSNETVLSWFDYPVPSYWLVVHDVREARKHLNFSEIGNLPPAQQRAALFEAVSQIELGAMPLPPYKRLHPESAVTPEQLVVLRKYLSNVSSSDASSPAEIASADEQYTKWIQSAEPPQTVAPSPNGIAFLPDYKNWTAISSTERFDNRTLRQILGNDVAIKAIADKHINPWPNGTAFAKVAWLQQVGDDGSIRPGAFFQVEFMIRDSKKYASTLGWGWSRWRGTDLKPYGKDSHFDQECVGCHRPLADANYVFTMPIRVQP